jgi:hypothetical protein
MSFGMGYSFGSGYIMPYYSMGGFYPYWGYSSYPGDFVFAPAPRYYHQSLIPAIERQIEEKKMAYFGRHQDVKPEQVVPPENPAPIQKPKAPLEIRDNTQPHETENIPEPQDTLIVDNGTVTISSY